VEGATPSATTLERSANSVSVPFHISVWLRPHLCLVPSHISAWFRPASLPRSVPCFHSVPSRFLLSPFRSVFLLGIASRFAPFRSSASFALVPIALLRPVHSRYDRIVPFLSLAFFRSSHSRSSVPFTLVTIFLFRKPQPNHEQATSSHKQTPANHKQATNRHPNTGDTQPVPTLLSLPMTTGPTHHVTVSAHQPALHVKRLFDTATTSQQMSGTWTPATLPPHQQIDQPHKQQHYQ